MILYFTELLNASEYFIYIWNARSSQLSKVKFSIEVDPDESCRKRAKQMGHVKEFFSHISSRCISSDIGGLLFIKYLLPNRHSQDVVSTGRSVAGRLVHEMKCHRTKHHRTKMRLPNCPNTIFMLCAM